MISSSLLSPDSVPPPKGHYSLGTVSDRLIFTAGQIGSNPKTGTLEVGIEAQIRRIFLHLHDVLAAGGSDLRHVLKTTCFLANPSDFPLFDAIYGELMPTPFPARSTVIVGFADPDLLVEVEAIAVAAGDR